MPRQWTAEYISSGLGIVSSPGIGDVSMNIEKSKIIISFLQLQKKQNIINY